MHTRMIEMGLNILKDLDKACELAEYQCDRCMLMQEGERYKLCQEIYETVKIIMKNAIDE